MKRILTVGDGDLTLSLSLARAYTDQIDLFASTLLPSKEELCRTYSNSAEVLEELALRKVPVWYGIDATRLHRVVKQDFDVILFHHPHLGCRSGIDNEQENAKKHFVLLCHYFWSARHVAKHVHVCLCGTQDKTWRVREAAAHQGLVCTETISTTCPHWLLGLLPQEPILPHYPAPRRYRNGKLGSKHAMGKYGYRHQRTHTGDMNVTGSQHYYFQQQPQQQPQQHNHDNHHRIMCHICESVFRSVQDLERHQEQPAIPDIIVETKSCDSEQDGGCQVDKPDVPTTPILLETTVPETHNEKRLRWYLRQPGVSTLSKKQCDDCIKEGRVVVNGVVAIDSSRILHTGNHIVVHTNNNNNNNNNNNKAMIPSIVVVVERHDGMVVAMKPVGMRTVGRFSDQTLEETVSRQMGDTYTSASNLDTGCAGLCVLCNTTTRRNISVVQIFTALVFGHVPDEWCHTTTMTIERAKQWGKETGTERVQLVCRERIPTLSTVEITTTNASSGVCHAVCYLLRKLGHAVVNDRFCRNEYLQLPRSVRNLIKNRLCIGCYGVRVEGEHLLSATTTVTEPPPRLLARHWQSHYPK